MRDSKKKEKRDHWEVVSKRQNVHREVCEGDRADPAYLSAHQHYCQPAAVLPQWGDSGQQQRLTAGLAHGGPHWRRNFCEYFSSFFFFLIFFSIFHFQFQFQANINVFQFNGKTVK